VTLELDRIEVRYGQAVAVAGVSLAPKPRSWTLIIGPNGAGKTSLLRAAMGLVRHSGRVLVEGRTYRGFRPGTASGAASASSRRAASFSAR
jgi:iron complex transport system ATP-binding protein